MRSYAEIMADAGDRSAFANGTEGDHWMDQWCHRCVHDLRIDEGGCPLVLVSMLGKTPTEFVPGATGEYRCTEFACTT